MQATNAPVHTASNPARIRLNGRQTRASDINPTHTVNSTAIVLTTL